MITLTGSIDASAAAMQGLRQATESAGRSIVAIAGGEVPSPSEVPASGGAVSPVTPSAPGAAAVGTRLNTVA